jgi:hypothetical protein
MVLYYLFSQIGKLICHSVLINIQCEVLGVLVSSLTPVYGPGISCYNCDRVLAAHFLPSNFQDFDVFWCEIILRYKVVEFLVLGWLASALIFRGQMGESK